MAYKVLSRNRQLKVPKVLKNETGPLNTMDDLFATRQGIAMGENKKFNTQKEVERLKSYPSQPALASGNVERNQLKRTGIKDMGIKNTQTKNEAICEHDAHWEQVCQIPEESSDLIVMTKAKKLSAYILTVTQKSPAKFRGVFVTRLQNFSLDIVQDLISANFIRQESPENKNRREQFQMNAIVKLKMLGYIAMVAQNAGCILMRQYKQISILIGETVNLTTAWKKSDDEKWREKQTRF